MSPFAIAREPGIGWFRVFGYGLHWKDARRHFVFFSERNGLQRRSFRVGVWSFKVLVP